MTYCVWSWYRTSCGWTATIHNIRSQFSSKNSLVIVLLGSATNPFSPIHALEFISSAPFFVATPTAIRHSCIAASVEWHHHYSRPSFLLTKLFPFNLVKQCSILFPTTIRTFSISFAWSLYCSFGASSLRCEGLSVSTCLNQIICSLINWFLPTLLLCCHFLGKRICCYAQAYLWIKPAS